ncbi:unnamed protein product [Closterium sp. Naga37s-1]|nr:unnamed protein product [Closterium sp. Naga37s-1]
MYLTKLVRAAASERALVPAADDAAAAASGQSTAAIRGDGAFAVKGVEGTCGLMSEERDGGWGDGAAGSGKGLLEGRGGRGDGEGSGRELVWEHSGGREEGAREDGEEHGRSGCCRKRRKNGKQEGDLEDVSKRKAGRGVQEQEGEGVQEANGPEEVLSGKHANSDLFQVVGAEPEKAGTGTEVGSEQLQVVGAENDEAEQLRVQPLSRCVLQREPLFDQMIANWYSGDQGIKPHVDLMRFDDGIAILSLLSPCAKAKALYRDALRTARLAPPESRADLEKIIRDEAEKHAGESDISKIRFYMSEGMQRLKELKSMLDNQGR